MGGRRGSKFGIQSIQSWECVSSTLHVSSSGPAHLPLAIGEGASRLGFRQKPPLLLTLLSFSLCRLVFARLVCDSLARGRRNQNTRDVAVRYRNGGSHDVPCSRP